MTTSALLISVPSDSAPSAFNKIKYISADLKNYMVFDGKNVAVGRLADLDPFAPSSYAVKEIKASDGVKCLSIGTAATGAQFAIKRPVKLGQTYQCLKTSFHVSRCFDSCQAAIIDVDRPLTGAAPGTRRAYLYIDNCLGLLGSSEVADMTNAIPLDALWLRGTVGVLADPNFPRCRQLR